MLVTGDDFWIEQNGGQGDFPLDAKALRMRSTLLCESANDLDLFRIQARRVRMRDTMDINDATGGTATTVHNALPTSERDGWQLDVPGRAKLVALIPLVLSATEIAVPSPVITTGHLIG